MPSLKLLNILNPRAIEKHRENIYRNLEILPYLNFEEIAIGNYGWTKDLILATYYEASTGKIPEHLEYRIGNRGDGFDSLDFKYKQSFDEKDFLKRFEEIDLSIDLNKRNYGEKITIPVPFYGAGMSFGSISLNVMIARAMSAKALGTFTSTGEGGYPKELMKFKENVITQISTGYFGVREETILISRIIEFKYAQGAKPGLGGHLLAPKVTPEVAEMREVVPFVNIYQPFPFHSVYSVEDHKKHVDWIRAVNPNALVSVKVSTPIDVDMVAIGIYYAGAHIIHLDGGYGGTGASPEFAKKNIAMPIEFAIPKVHNFLLAEGVRENIILMASGGIRTPHDVAKAIALGADGCIIGTAELIALGCTQCGNCEKGGRGRGCQIGIATTNKVLSSLQDPVWGSKRIINMYKAWCYELKKILYMLDLDSIRKLKGRKDLLLDKGPSFEGKEEYE
jgi:glutamate synthase domain-containing protein 2